MATINFTNYADYVDAYNYGTAFNTFNLLKGEDVFHGSYVRATVYGGDGADDIYGSSGNDILYGDTGWDYIDGDTDSDTIYGGDCNDYFESQWDSFYDVMFGGNGNDYFHAGGDKVSAGAGNDQVSIGLSRGGEHADVTLGIGRDTLTIGVHESDYANYNETRIDVLDFKADDKLSLSAASLYPYEFLNHGQVLDRLDVDNDGWLGAKDVEAYDYDDITVHVGQNFLELDIMDTSVFLHGMTKASFDFLA